MTLQVNMRRAQPTESRELREWIAEHHYTKSAPPGYVLALEFSISGKRVGGMLFGRPASRALDAAGWLELTRMFFIDATPPMVESHALKMARRHIRVWLPAVFALIAYSDPSVGHDGTVYRADRWAPFGKTSNSKHGWSNRPNRKPPTGERPSRKTRWIRTP